MSEKRIFVVDSQITDTAQLCPTKYMYAFHLRKQSEEKGDRLEEGDLVHKVLQTYYTLKKYRSRWSINGFDYRRVCEVCIRVAYFWGAKMNIDANEEVIPSLRQYFDFYEYESEEIVLVEQPMAKVIYDDDDLTIIYQGKIDLIKNIVNYGLMPVDHKKQRQRRLDASKKNIVVNQHSNQFKGYCWLLDVYNIQVNIVGLQKSLRPEEKFQRPQVSFNKEVLDEWVDNTIWWTKMLIHHIDTGHFPMNFTSCDKYGGCIYTDICATDPRSRLWKLERDFIDVPVWDVGKVLSK